METLSYARARLVCEFSAAPTSRTIGPVRRRTLLVAAAATVAVAAGAGLTVRPADPPAEPLTLAAVTVPEFPLTLRSRPSPLAPPRYSYEPGRFVAVYLSPDGVDDVYLAVADGRPTGIAPTSRRVVVGGRPAQIYEEPSTGAPRALVLVWERSPEQWVSLAGHGRFTEETALLRLAGEIVDGPQQVPLRVRLAPRGWRVSAFKDDTILTLRGDSADETLSVQVAPGRNPDLMHTVMGAREERVVTVGGRDARLVRADDFWFLQTEMPGGSVVNLQAPLRLSADQVVAIAEQVSVTPRGR
ncbi:hypothetical protein ABZ328_00550 [Micromonospora aurantiaca]|uniref:hypothetical protein n=1 Tax=Micromonospora aurantiaca (nom. illeg.) TaxID=47850 RepID=UPI0033ECA93C